MASEGKRRLQSDGGRDSKRPAHAKPAATAAAPASKLTPLFGQFRDKLDAHHDRRERVVKASRDITALSKKIIFALQRVRRIHPDLPADVNREVESRLSEIGRLLAGIAPEMQGINRGRYGGVLFGMEELIEALTFRHYLRCQTLLSYDEACEQVAQLCRDGVKEKKEKKEDEEKRSEEQEIPPEELPVVLPSENDYIMGCFDLSGEMMRFATTSAALRGELTSESASGDKRSIVTDMQDLGSFFAMLPQRSDRSWQAKSNVLRTSVQKVERLGYDLRVRGSERPKGWVPETDVEVSG